MTPSSRVQSELLRELKEAAPMAAVAQSSRPEPRPAPATSEQRDSAFELHVTPQRWSQLRISGVPGGQGLSAALGPLRLSLRVPGR